MGLWRLLAKLVKVSPDQTWFITDDKAGRLIYEEFDSTAQKSSAKSKFFEVKFGKIHPRKVSDDDSVSGLVEINLSDVNMASELTED